MGKDICRWCVVITQIKLQWLFGNIKLTALGPWETVVLGHVPCLALLEFSHSLSTGGAELFTDAKIKNESENINQSCQANVIGSLWVFKMRQVILSWMQNFFFPAVINVQKYNVAILIVLEKRNTIMVSSTQTCPTWTSALHHHAINEHLNPCKLQSL